MKAVADGLQDLGRRLDRSLGLEERPQERRPCASCRGTGYRECPSCRAIDGDSPCESCNGSGLEDCPICDDDATVTTGRRWPF